MSSPVWGAEAPKAKVRDVYGLVSLTLAVASIGFVLGPALVVGFGWAFGTAAVVVGTQSDGDSRATIGQVIGLLVTLVSVGLMFAS